MAKFNNVLVTGYRQQQEQEKKQNELKSKHHIDDPNVVVVEKSNMAKFTVKTVTTALRTVANIQDEHLKAKAMGGLFHRSQPTSRTYAIFPQRIGSGVSRPTVCT